MKNKVLLPLILINMLCGVGYREDDEDCGVFLEFAAILRRGVAGWRGPREQRRASC